VRRITPDEVKAAYEATGLTPRGGEYVGEGCACGLGVLLVAALGDKVLGMGDVRIERRIPGTLGIGMGYLYGFVNGFDGEPFSISSPTKYHVAGYEDGAAARAAVGLA
jgi:hypothetical protein